jgi:hypothetical protein
VHQRQVGTARGRVAVGDGLEVAVGGLHLALGHTLDQLSLRLR